MLKQGWKKYKAYKGNAPARQLKVIERLENKKARSKLISEIAVYRNKTRKLQPVLNGKGGEFFSFNSSFFKGIKLRNPYKDTNHKSQDVLV